jgi:hypothetical protein
VRVFPLAEARSKDSCMVDQPGLFCCGTGEQFVLLDPHLVVRSADPLDILDDECLKRWQEPCSDRQLRAKDKLIAAVWAYGMIAYPGRIKESVKKWTAPKRI